MAGESAHYDIKIRVFDKPLDDLEKKTDRFEKKIGGLAGAFSKVFAGAAVLAGVGLLTKKIVGLGAEMEQTRVSFTTMLGSADKANNTLKELTKFAIATPFRQGEVVTGAKQLLAYGFAAEGLTGNLRMLGDVASGLSIPLGDLVYLYGTVRTQGRAMTKDIMQFANRGIPIYDALNKITGKYGQSLNKAIENGEITFGVIEKAFKKMTEEGSMFGGLMEKQAKTLSGRWSTFLDVLENTGRSIGEKLNPTLGKLLDNVSGMLKSFDSTEKKLEDQRAITSLIERYYKLSTSLNRSSEESKELQGLTKSIADLIPNAVSKWDAYGNAIEISNSKLRDNIKLSAQKELILKRQSAQNSFDDILSISKKISSKNNLLAQNLSPLGMGKSMSIGGAQGFASQKQYAITNQEKNEIREDITALQKDLSEAYKTYSAATGEIGSPKLEKAFKEAGLGQVYRDLLKQAVDARLAGIITKGTPGGDTATGTSGGGSTKAGIEKISSATRNITLNINNLVNSLNFTKDPARNEYDMEEMVKRVLLRAVNDVNLVQ
jgi:hypothetical protein